ncbi:MAG: DUF2231 domain-containing protein [Candidatus Bipolaricaulia bacterium]
MRIAELRDSLLEYHWHPPSVHFHNALFPLAALLIIIYLPTHEGSLEKAAFYVLGFAVLLLLGSILAGFFDWRTKYKAARTKLFQSKIRLSFVLLGLGLVLLIWRGTAPGLMEVGPINRGLYTAGLLLATGLVVRIGYLGGKLIFRRGR